MSRKAMDQETLEKIIRVARDHFLQHGYHKASMREIAATAGITTKPLYYHFGSKGDLLIRVCLYGFDLIEKRFEVVRQVSEGQPLVDRMMAYYDSYVSFFVEFKGYHDVITLTMSYLDRLDIEQEKKELLYKAVERIWDYVDFAGKEPGEAYPLEVILYGSLMYGIIHHVRAGYFDRNNIPLGVVRKGVHKVVQSFMESNAQAEGAGDGPKSKAAVRVSGR